jgi:hypothetical protein
MRDPHVLTDEGLHAMTSLTAAPLIIIVGRVVAAEGGLEWLNPLISAPAHAGMVLVRSSRRPGGWKDGPLQPDDDGEVVSA